MTAPRDADRLIRAYLEVGPTRLPDRSYDEVRARIDQTRQRVVICPWRQPRVTALTRLALVAVAVPGGRRDRDGGRAPVECAARPCVDTKPDGDPERDTDCGARGYGDAPGLSISTGDHRPAAADPGAAPRQVGGDGHHWIRRSARAEREL